MKKCSSVLSLVNSIYFLVTIVFFFFYFFIYNKIVITERHEGIGIAILLGMTAVCIPFVIVFSTTGIVLSSICLKKKELSLKSYRVISIFLIILDIIQILFYGYTILDIRLWNFNYCPTAISLTLSIVLAFMCILLKIISLIKNTNNNININLEHAK